MCKTCNIGHMPLRCAARFGIMRIFRKRFHDTAHRGLRCAQGIHHFRVVLCATAAHDLFKGLIERPCRPV